MAHSTESFQILVDILSAFGVRFHVVQLKVSGIGRVPFVVRPVTVAAHVYIAPQHLATDIIRNMPVMFRALPIRL
jgi:hypothetical protein